MIFLEELHQNFPSAKTWEDYNSHVYNTVTQQIVEMKKKKNTCATYYPVPICKGDGGWVGQFPHMDKFHSIMFSIYKDLT